MTEPKARPFDPTKPWATGEQAARRVVALIVAVTVAQFALNGLQNLIDGIWMFVAWWVAALLVGVATFRIEKYFTRRRRFLR